LKVGGCGPNQNIQNKKWCSSGSTATIRLENLRGFSVSMVQKYSFYMTAVSICSEDARIPQEQVSEPGMTILNKLYWDREVPPRVQGSQSRWRLCWVLDNKLLFQRWNFPIPHEWIIIGFYASTIKWLGAYSVSPAIPSFHPSVIIEFPFIISATVALIQFRSSSNLVMIQWFLTELSLLKKFSVSVLSFCLDVHVYWNCIFRYIKGMHRSSSNLVSVWLFLT
jgi:hypothetical protein